MRREELVLRLRTSGDLIRWVYATRKFALANCWTKHMHHTRGFEYPDAFITGSGAVAANGDRDKRRSRRVSSSQSNSHGRTETTELAGRPPASRRQSSKGKARARNSTADIHPALDPAARDRSRSQRRRGPESDQEQNGDPNHERRLREVRGARRKNNDDQI